MAENFQQLDHFSASQRSEIVEAGDAIINEDVGTFRHILDRLAESDLVKSIHTKVTTCRANSKFFFDSLKGIGALGVGVGFLLETVEVAAFLGLGTISVYVIAILLILYAISKLLPAIWDRMLNCDLVSGMVRAVTE